jgi:hypothetical protein
LDEFLGGLDDIGGSVAGAFDATEDVGECNAERMIMNIGLLGFITSSLAATVYFGKLNTNFKHKAGDLIEAALVVNEPAEDLLKRCTEGTPDIARAAILKISALLAGATMEVAFEDKPNEFFGQKQLDEFRDAGCAAVLCTLAKHIDPVIRMHTAEAIGLFIREPQCMQAFVEGAGGEETGLHCMMHLIAESCAVQREGKDNYTLTTARGSPS